MSTRSKLPNLLKICKNRIKKCDFIKKFIEVIPKNNRKNIPISNDISCKKVLITGKTCQI